MGSKTEQVFFEIEGDKTGARIFGNNLIMDENRNIHLLTGYGPIQEVRCFAHLLNLDGFKFSARFADDSTFSQYHSKTPHIVRIAHALENQMAVYVAPSTTDFILGPNKEACREIFRRLLGQQEFVLPEWVDPLFAMLPRIEAQVGTMFCYRNNLNIEQLVAEKIASGSFLFPPPSASLTLDQKTADGEHSR